MANTKLSLEQIVDERAAVCDTYISFMYFSFVGLKKIENQSKVLMRLNYFKHNTILILNDLCHLAPNAE